MSEVDPIHEAWQQMDDDNVRAAALYEALRATKRLPLQRRIAYRCAARKCLLLDVVQVPGQLIAHIPPYKLSPEVNEATSNADGRAANTRDGDRRWLGHTFGMGSAINFGLNCDHVQKVLLEKHELQADIDAGHTEMTVKSDGERSPS